MQYWSITAQFWISKRGIVHIVLYCTPHCTSYNLLYEQLDIVCEIIHYIESNIELF